MLELYSKNLDEQIRLWLQEDIGQGDITTMATTPVDQTSRGIIHVKEDGWIAGIPVAERVFHVVDPELRFCAKIGDGEHVKKGTILAEVEGRTRSILTGERLALNLTQRLSGIATKTRSFVEQVQDLPVRIVDTRKTTPGHRDLEKYAVRVGGGHNHRFGLSDAVLIKDNHIKSAGSVKKAISAARNHIPHTMKIEVETENAAQVQDAVEARADIIMLDNMPPQEMKSMVEYIKSMHPHIIVEASGSVNVNNVREIALTGVDVVSAGSLTYSVHALDISLDIGEKKEAAR